MNNKTVKNEVKYEKTANGLLADQYGIKMSRSLKITGAAATASTLIAIGKLAMGIISLSLFACVNSFYTFGMVIAKVIALMGIRKAKEKSEQYRYYLWSGFILIVSSLIYMIYSIRLFFSPISNSFHMYVAIGISTVTFTEVVLNIRGVIITRHKHTILVHAIKMINLSASLIALVLTQTAILSFAEKDFDLVERSNANGVIGLLMGSLATMIGIYMVCRVRKFKREDEQLEIDY